MEMVKMIAQILIAIACLACLVYLFSGESDLEEIEKEDTTKMIINTVISKPVRM